MKWISDDYRFGSWEIIPDFSDNSEKLRKKIKDDHPRVRNHYKWLDKNQPNYRRIFFGLFENRCCYCGNSQKASFDVNNFQIDHIYSPGKKEESPNNDLNNLAPACRVCNRKKSDIVISTENASLINPYLNIANLFYRDKDFYILIKNKYRNNALVNRFYKELDLNHEFHRITFLIMCLKRLCAYYDNNRDIDKKDKVRTIIEVLREGITGTIV